MIEWFDLPERPAEDRRDEQDIHSWPVEQVHIKSSELKRMESTYKLLGQQAALWEAAIHWKAKYFQLLQRRALTPVTEQSNSGLYEIAQQMDDAYRQTLDAKCNDMEFKQKMLAQLSSVNSRLSQMSGFSRVEEEPEVKPQVQLGSLLQQIRQKPSLKPTVNVVKPRTSSISLKNIQHSLRMALKRQRVSMQEEKVQKDWSDDEDQDVENES